MPGVIVDPPVDDHLLVQVPMKMSNDQCRLSAFILQSDVDFLQELLLGQLSQRNHHQGVCVWGGGGGGGEEELCTVQDALCLFNTTVYLGMGTR